VWPYNNPMAAPLILLNAVGLTPRLLPHAPRLAVLGGAVPLRDVVPAVTMSAQATMLTGKPVEEHGIVGNGWLFRDTNEIRFWQQSNRLMQAEPVYATARRRARERGRPFKSAKLFWWFNQGAAVDISVTPKPHYGIDGNKVFGITGVPDGYTDALEKKLGAFPFHTFWGPMAGPACTEWIARCAAEVVTAEKPDLTLVYLPHLDYDPQRFGPGGCDMPKLVQQLDDFCVPILDAAKRVGARVWVVSEYGHCDVSKPVYLNRALRKAGFLTVRRGPFGEQLEPYLSRAFAVCDHQVAHVYVREPEDVSRVRDVLAGAAGVARVLAGDERGDVGLRHERAGELVALSDRDAWFAYPFWLDDKLAPDYARTVAIHHKPGYDPAELFFDPKLWLPEFKAARRLVQKKLGFRTKMDVVPLDASVVKGSHGLVSADLKDGPLLVCDEDLPVGVFPMTTVRDRVLDALELS
jgi:predicted AlkP superfamily pyrophosphatase or phosphodiesterase